MPRIVSSEMLQAMYSQETGEAIIVLLTIDHADLLQPLRVTSDGADTVSNGNTFTSFPFDFVVPNEPEDGRSPRTRVQISNVDRQIVEALRGIGAENGPPTFDAMIVRASEPDQIEAQWPQFTLREGIYDGMWVSGELSLDDILQVRYPADSYMPSLFPGLF